MWTKEIDHLVTRADAKKLIQRRNGQRVYLSARVELPIVDDPGKCFPGYAVVRLTQTQALKVVYSMLDGFEGRGARIKIEERHDDRGGISLYL